MLIKQIPIKANPHFSFPSLRRSIPFSSRRFHRCWKPPSQLATRVLSTGMAFPSEIESCNGFDCTGWKALIPPESRAKARLYLPKSRRPTQVKMVFHPIICCRLSADLAALAYGKLSNCGLNLVLGYYLTKASSNLELVNQTRSDHDMNRVQCTESKSLCQPCFLPIFVRNLPNGVQKRR